MSKPCGTHVLSGIAAARVSIVMQQVMLDDPISVSKKQDADGTFTVTAEFAPCEEGNAGVPHLVATLAAPAVAPVVAPGAQLKRGFDHNGDCTGLIGKIVAHGVDFVARYYSHNNTKNLSVAEAKALSAAGVRLVSVWESAGNHAGFFSKAQGMDDATSAHNLAAKIGQPPGTPIYFAVDFDASVAEVNALVVPYFQGVAEGLAAMGHGAPDYLVGVYGSGFVCGKLKGLNLASHTWLSMSMGWLGSKTYSDWNILQHLDDDPFGFGFKIDPDDAKEGYGGFLVT